MITYTYLGTGPPNDDISVVGRRSPIWHNGSWKVAHATWHLSSRTANHCCWHSELMINPCFSFTSIVLAMCYTDYTLLWDVLLWSKLLVRRNSNPHSLLSGSDTTPHTTSAFSSHVTSAISSLPVSATQDIVISTSRSRLKKCKTSIYIHVHFEHKGRHKIR